MYPQEKINQRKTMSLMNFIKGELLEIIEWQDDSRDTIARRYPDDDKAIKNGAQLIVRESQVAQFLYLGQFGDTFGPGKHTLATDNIPVLTRLKGWKYGFQSPFKADVYYVNTRLFTGNKWGTSNPIMIRDADFGIVRARAFGTYDFKVTNVQTFLREVAGSDHDFRVNEFEDSMRSRVVSIFSEALASSNVPMLDVATRYSELGDALLPIINPVMSVKYGIEIASFIVENVSVPPEVEEAIDKRSAMSAIGDLNSYIKYQMGQGMAAGGEGGGGAGGAGAAAELAVGFSIAQELMKQSGVAGGGMVMPGAAPAADGVPPTPQAAAAAQGLPQLFEPAQVAQMLGVSEADVMSEISSGKLEAKQIGASYRITRSALDAFLGE